MGLSKTFLPELPKGWHYYRLGSIGEFTSSGIDKLTRKDESLVKIVNYTDIYRNEAHILTNQEYMIVSAPVDKITNHLLKKGDMVFTPSSESTEDIGISSVVVEDLENTCYSYHVLRYRPWKEIDDKYKRYMCNNHAVLNYFSSCCTGSIRQTLSRTDFKNCLVPYPPLTVQKNIGAYLVKTCAEIDKIAKTELKKIEKLQEYKDSVKINATVMGYDKQELVDSGIKWIGLTPNNWSLFKIGALYSESKESGQDNLPFLTISINSGISNKELSDVEQDRTFIRSEDASSNKRVRPNDLAYNMMRAWQGAFGAAKVEGMISSAYVVARPKVKICSKFMEWLLRTPNAMEEIRTRSHGIADFRLRLYWNQFKDIKVSIPSYEEQLEIVEATEKKLIKIDEYISKIQKHIELLNEYKQSLIYETITGETDVA